MFDNLKAFVGPVVGNAVMKTKAASPELYLAGAGIAFVASVILIAKAHKGHDERVAAMIEERELVDETLEYLAEEEGHEITEQERRIAGLRPVANFAVQTAIAYGPGIVAGVGAVGLVLASHGVMKGRVNGLASAAVLLETGWRTYRERVVEELGVEADERFLYGADVKAERVTLRSEDGKTVKKGKKVNKNHIPESFDPASYNRVFTAENIRWRNDDNINLSFLEAIQQQMQDLWYVRGWLTLNEVYDALGFPVTDYGQVVGWSAHDPRSDGYISLGLEKDINQRMSVGDTKEWVITPNVDGVIMQWVGLPKPDKTLY